MGVQEEEDKPKTDEKDKDSSIFGYSWGLPVKGDAHLASMEGDMVELESLIFTEEDANLMDEEETTPLHHAAYGGFIDCCRFLVEMGVDIDHRDINGYTALQIAVFQGHYPVVKFLVECGANVYLRDSNQSTAIHKAALFNQSECLSALLEEEMKASPREKSLTNAETISREQSRSNKDGEEEGEGEGINAKTSRGWAPLHLASECGHVECVRLLLKCPNIDVNILSKEGMTPLHKAAIQGRSECVKELLDAKADWRIRDKEGATPLHNATYIGHSECTSLILNAIRSGSDGNNVDTIDCKDRDGITPLHQCAYNGHFDCARLLIDASAARDSTDNSNYTPLHFAAAKGHGNCIRILLGLEQEEEKAGDKTATPQDKPQEKPPEKVPEKLSLSPETAALLERKDNSGATALHKASFYGHSSCVQLLLDSGSNINAKDNEGATPLHKACHRGDDACVKLLIEGGAAIEIKDKRGETALHKAARNGHDECVDFIIKRGGNADWVDNSNSTPLHIAAKEGHLACLEKLITPTNVNAPDNRKNTPLHLGSKKGHLGVVQYLCSNKNILVNQQNDMAQTPLHEAIIKGYKEIARELIMENADPNIQDKNGQSAVEMAKSGNGVSFDDIQSYMQERARRRDHFDPETQARMKRCVALFNSKPAKGLQMLIKEKIIPNDVHEIAKLLHTNEELDKKKIGELLGEADQLELLQAFVDYYQFAGIHFEVALRRFLCKFRLPGEAQKIDRMMECFAKRFYDQNKNDVFENADAAYVLAFSTIMLNTDAHNPAIKKQNKMTKQQFLTNNRGINNGHDVESSYMERLYDRIVEEEIKMDATGSLFANAEKKGWMIKQGGRIKTWKKRWFVLSNNCLYYFRTPNDSEACGYIPLENLEVVKNSGGGRRYAFTIQSKEGAEGQIRACKLEDGQVVTGNHSRFVFGCETKEDMEEWVSCMNSCIQAMPLSDKLQDRIASNDSEKTISKKNKRISKKLKKIEARQTESATSSTASINEDIEDESHDTGDNN